MVLIRGPARFGALLLALVSLLLPLLACSVLAADQTTVVLMDDQLAFTVCDDNKTVVLTADAAALAVLTTEKNDVCIVENSYVAIANLTPSTVSVLCTTATARDAIWEGSIAQSIYSLVGQEDSANRVMGFQPGNRPGRLMAA